MKKVFLLLALVSFTLISCDDDDDNNSGIDNGGGNTEEVIADTMEVDATASAMWHYLSLSESKEVGAGTQSDSADAAWFARTDWDIAINRYHIRTNSGKSTTAGSYGGVYTCDKDSSFSVVSLVPDDDEFVVDSIETISGHGSSTDMSCSVASVIVFKQNDDGSLVMPPVYLKAPVYIFRTADGGNYYKLQFTQYINENNESGHVIYISSKL